MRAGELRHRIRIDAPTLSAADEVGSKTPSWAPFATQWAAIEPLAGREYFAQKQTGSEATVRIRMRYLAGVLPKMRAVLLPDATRIFDIESVIHVETRGRELQLMCREKVA